MRRLDMTGVAAHHRFQLTRWQRALPCAFVALALAQVVLALLGTSWWPAVLTAAVAALQVVSVAGLRRSGTELAADGFQLRNGFARPRHVPWDEVEELRPRERWRTLTDARLRGGRVVVLHGVPDDVVALVAARLGLAPAPPPAGARLSDQRGPGTGSMEGPFRRG